MSKTKLTKEESDILSSYERGEWRPVKDMPSEIARYKEMAKNPQRKVEGRLQFAATACPIHPLAAFGYNEELLNEQDQTS